MANEL